MVNKGQHISISELQKLLTGCLAKDRSCQRKIYDVFAPPMMSLSLRYAKNREEAEEILQDGFVQVFKHMGQFKNTGSFEGWVRRIMINCALQRYRGEINSFRQTVLTEDIYIKGPQMDQLDRLSEKELIRMVHNLPPASRMVFNLFVFEGLKHREIASLLNITEGTSKSNLSDARNILKKQINPDLKIAR